MTAPTPTPDGPDAFTFEIIRHRLTAINDEAALAVTRVAGTTLVTEATDMNSALMLADGTVAVFGEFVLVHSCSLDNVVTDVLDHYRTNPGIRPGDMFITNDPYVTGTHQLDAVVVAPIFDGDDLVAWSGTVVHQSDVGGPSPGSVTIGARSIYEEAVPMAPMKIVEGGEIRNDVQREYLIRTRTPDLNNLDLLAQIAANRLFGQRVLELCRTYGTAAVTGTMLRLVRGTERQLRELLADLPDGVWRYHGYNDHDGIEDKLYVIRLEMTKRGDSLVLDFRESSEQAPSLINLTRNCLLNNALIGVIILLGFDGIGWVPGAFANVVEILSTPGTIMDCVWPAGAAVGSTFAGQEARTAVNVCITRMLDASERYADKALASCMCSAPGQAVSGWRPDGSFFTTTLLDAQGGGAGARTFADGSDVSGPFHAPGGASANIETNEHAYPMRYLWRRERPDSGGPGRRRGGIGSTFAYTAHGAGAPVELTLFAHGVSHPTSAGVLGGEPGSQHGFLILRTELDRAWTVDPTASPDGAGEVPAAKATATIDGDDVMVSWCAGGGGLGDPLERPAEEVALDVRQGLVTPAGARRDYGVVLQRDQAGGWVVDIAATDARRLAVRCERLGGSEPEPVAGAVPGRWFGSDLALDGDTVVCRRCGHRIGPAAANLRTKLRVEERPLERRWPLAGRHRHPWRLVVRHFFCPGCAKQLDVEVAPPGEPPLWASQVDLDGYRSTSDGGARR